MTYYDTLVNEVKPMVERGLGGCIVPNIPPIITVDKLRVRTHRVVWQWVNGPLRGGEVVIRSCQTVGCVNPAHHFKRPGSKPRRDKCVKGHRLGPRDELPNGQRRCLACTQKRNAIRNAQRRKNAPMIWERRRRLDFCPAGHPYSRENTYVYVTPGGWTNRKCKACTIARNKGLDPSSVVADW